MQCCQQSELFDNNLATNPVSGTKVIAVLIDFGQEMEEILEDMKSLFDGLKATPLQATPLELVLNISMDTKEILSLNVWGARAAETTPMPTKLDQLEAFKLAKDT